jgi:hypothetical protein
VAAHLNADPNNVRVTLHRMKNAGEVLARDGRYLPVDDRGVIPVMPVMRSPKTDATTPESEASGTITPSITANITPPPVMGGVIAHDPAKTDVPTRKLAPTITGITGVTPGHENHHAPDIAEADFADLPRRPKGSPTAPTMNGAPPDDPWVHAVRVAL